MSLYFPISRSECRYSAQGRLNLAPLSQPGKRIAMVLIVCAITSYVGTTVVRGETAQSAEAATETEEAGKAAQGGDAAASPVAVNSDSPENLELANRLLESQRRVAELKREDFIEAGMAETIRPKFAAALRKYEALRNEVLRRRPVRQPAEEGENYELYFNGVTSFVELPLKYQGEVPYTIEAIITPEPIPGFKVNPETHAYAHCMAIVADTEFGGIELGLSPNQLTFDVMSRSEGWYVKVQKDCLPFLETRVHIAVVIDMEELRLYKNGKLVGKTPFDGAVGHSPFTMRIGCSPHPVTECHEMFRGCIDEVRFTADALYLDDFSPPNRLEASESTVALYHLDEGRGETVKDSSANGHDGIVHDARWVGAAD